MFQKLTPRHVATSPLPPTLLHHLDTSRHHRHQYHLVTPPTRQTAQQKSSVSWIFIPLFHFSFITVFLDTIGQLRPTTTPSRLQMRGGGVSRVQMAVYTVIWTLGIFSFRYLTDIFLYLF
jgi:hypothetical protein